MATATTPTTPTTAPSANPTTTTQVKTPATTGVQPVNAFTGTDTSGAIPQQTATMDPLAFQANGSAPAGFTQGTGSMAGATYYNGSKVTGYDQAGNPLLENGQTIQGAGPALQAWTASPTFNQNAVSGISNYSQPTTAQDFANGVNAYGQMWKAGAAPPPGLSGDQLNAWMRANPNAAGYSQDVWNQLASQQGANSTYNTLAQQVAAGTPLTDAQQSQFNDASSALAATAPAWASITQGAANSPTANATQSGYYDYSSGSPVWVNPANTPAQYLQGGQTIDANGNPVPGGYNALLDYYNQTGTTPGAVNGVVMNLLQQNPNLMSQLPQTQYDTLVRTLGSNPGFNIPARAPDTTPGSQITTPTVSTGNPGSGVTGTGNTGTGTTGVGGTGTGSNSTTGTGTTMTSSGLMPNVSTVNPATDLRNQQITPGAMLDRFALANQQYGTYASATDPQYQAALRDAARSAAATGQLGSGMLRTSYGDLANTRAQSLQNERDALFQQALSGSVQDAQTRFQDLMAEQGYQTGAQNQAFNQAVTGQQLQEALTSGAFQRGLEALTAGQAGNPAQTQLALSQIWANQANAANMAAGGLMQGMGNASGGNNSSYDALLAYLQAQNSGIFNPVNIPADPTGISTTMPGVQQIGGFTGSY